MQVSYTCRSLTRVGLLSYTNQRSLGAVWSPPQSAPHCTAYVYFLAKTEGHLVRSASGMQLSSCTLLRDCIAISFVGGAWHNLKSTKGVCIHHLLEHKLIDGHLRILKNKLVRLCCPQQYIKYTKYTKIQKFTKITKTPKNTKYELWIL